MNPPYCSASTPGTTAALCFAVVQRRLHLASGFTPSFKSVESYKVADAIRCGHRTWLQLPLALPCVLNNETKIPHFWKHCTTFLLWCSCHMLQAKAFYNVALIQQSVHGHLVCKSCDRVGSPSRNKAGQNRSMIYEAPHYLLR